MAYLSLLTMASLGAYLAIAEPIQVNGVRDGLLHNGASTILVAFSGLSIPGIVLAAMFVGSAVLRHIDARTEELVDAARVRKSVFIGAQFVAGFIAVVASFAAVALGMLIAYATPAVHADSIGPMPWVALAIILFVHLLPNIFFSVAVVLLMVTFTRSLKYAVVGAICIVVMHSVANAMVVDSGTVAAVIDPFAGKAAIDAMAHWNASRLNADAPWDGLILLNRALWSTISLVMVAWALCVSTNGKRARPPKVAKVGTAAPDPRESGNAPVRVEHGKYAEAVKFVYLTRAALHRQLHSLPFWLCAFAMAVASFAYLLFSRSVDGTPVHLLTHYVLRAVLNGSSPAYMFVVGFIAGELVYMERDYRVSRLVDAFPVSDAARAASTLTTMAVLAGLLNLVSLLTGLIFQLAHGDADPEPWLYLQGFAFLTLPVVVFGAMSVAIQWASGNKYIGYLFTALAALIPYGLTMIGVRDHLWIFNTTSPIKYSDMGGFGPFAAPALWFDAYWLSLALAMAWLASSIRQRSDDEPDKRWLHVHAIAARPSLFLPVGVWVCSFIGLGSWIAWNTHVRNAFDAPASFDGARARYEARYASYADIEQPTIGSVDLTVDLHPGKRVARFTGTYVLNNTSRHEIATVALSFDPRTRLTWNSALGDRVIDDRDAGFSTIHLKRPLQPGQSIPLVFDLTYAHQGFTNDGGDTDIIENGTFLTSDLLPAIGYQRSWELSDSAARARFGLGSRASELTESSSTQRQGLPQVDFHAIISTDPDEIAIAPGKRVRSWTCSGRHCDEYASEGKMVNSYGILSGQWVATHARAGDIDIYVYAIPKHPWNIASIIDSARNSVETFGAWYGRYPLTEMKIVEFPEFRVFAQSFPGMIAYSGSLGFSSNTDATDAIDFPYFITAHEIAHQWWGQRLQPAQAAGSLLLTEGMAQYNAIEMMRAYRPASVAPLLHYLRARFEEGSAGQEHEQSVATIDEQAYVAYNKAPLALEAYQEIVGREVASQTIRSFFVAGASGDSAPARGATFVDALRRSVPPGSRDAFDAWFTGKGLPAAH
jgi:hypothetical protein